MGEKAVLRWIALVLILVLPSAGARASMLVDPFPITQIMAETGLDQVLVPFRDAVTGGAAASGVTDEAFIANWTAVAGRMFNPESMNRALAAEVAQQPLSIADKTALRQFYGSDLGRRVTATETAASLLSPAASDAATSDGRSIAAGLSDHRLSQYDAIFRAALPTLEALARQAIRVDIVAAVLAQNGRGKVDVPWLRVEQLVDREMPGAIQALTTDQRAFSAYIYRNLTDSEIDTLVIFLKSPAYRQLTVVIAHAMDDVVGNEVTRFGNAVAASSNQISA